MHFPLNVIYCRLLLISALWYIYSPSVLTVQQRIIYLYRNIINIRCGIIFPAQSTHNLCTHRMQAKHPPPPFPVLWSDSLPVLTWILVVKVFSQKWPMWNSPNYNLSMWSKVSLILMNSFSHEESWDENIHSELNAAHRNVLI